jgi:small multidrug resistance pump
VHRIWTRETCEAGRKWFLMGWVYLAIAVVSEVCGTLSLRAATRGRKVWYAAVAVGYLIAFTFMALTLAQGLGLGMVYGIWAAAGVALTAIACRVFFNEQLTLVMTGGIALVIVGVLLIETGSPHR